MKASIERCGVRSGSDLAIFIYKANFSDMRRNNVLPTPFISTFLLIHLSAPISANVGGSNSASQLMILGREYYQTSFGERYLLLAPLGIHIAAGLVRRGRIWFQKISHSKSLNLEKPSLLVSTAYVAMALVPVHYLVNRYYPSLDEAPIFGLSPSQLNYDYINYGLAHWPIRTWILYGVMVPAVCLHAAEGVITVARRHLRLNLKRGVWSRSLVLAGAFLTLTGLIAISKETILIYSGEAARYFAAYQKSLLYK